MVQDKSIRTNASGTNARRHRFHGHGSESTFAASLKTRVGRWPGDEAKAAMPPGEELRPALPNGIWAPAPNQVAEGTAPLPGEELRSVENLVADGTAPLPGEDIA
jgi:hypothetical protein